MPARGRSAYSGASPPAHDRRFRQTPPRAPDGCAPPRIGTRLVVCLGLSQLVGWGCMHYLIAVFGPLIGAELG
ncbi:hypothetical protein [Xenophilus sp. Marseille-Q4582]|uniref:hypothetical protein n=1 Tax=Xenophilus sp. Marseille-Q4582 TaxID=2866600 RepID=UPI001CE4863D|nr:hypothetical protein [Xenophilus sp. Marseille-Q4582]